MEQKSLIMEHRRIACEGRISEALLGLEDHAAALAAIGREGPPQPRWDQDWFPRLDAAMAYAMVANLRPQRIVEAGSGHSTRFMARAARDHDLACHITAIDPAPRAPLPRPGVDWKQQSLQDAGTDPFADLCAGDMAFFDGSHKLKPGSDVAFMFEHILPRLARGVVVHFHDIFLPDGYPAHWLQRGYNEQNAVAALLAGNQYEVLFASHYVVTRMADTLATSAAAHLPLLPGAIESSLWLRKTG